MLSKKDIQFIRSLSIKKYRQKYNKYIAEGEKICLEIIQQYPEQIEGLYALPEFAREHAVELAEKQVSINEVSAVDLKRCSQLRSPNKVLAVCRIPEPDTDFNTWEEDAILYLDDIRDPGNMGTLLRSAEWFGLKHVLLSSNCVDIYNPKCVQASMGSVFRVNALYTELVDFFGKVPT
jgi:TrmH family RNA methyltransferase